MKGKVGAGVLAAVFVAGIGCAFACTERIPAGYVGVVYSPRGGVVGDVLSQGWHLVSPAKKVTKYSIGIEQSYLTTTEDGDSPGDDSFSAPSKDGKGLTMELTFTYRFDGDKVATTFTQQKARGGKEVLKTFIKPNVVSWTKEITARYPVSEILGDKRAELNSVLCDYLAEKFNPYGIIIENASLINIEPDKETKAAISRKVNAQQELETAEVEAKTAKVNAEKDKEVALIEARKSKEAAEIQAEQARIEAQGKADAKKIAAEAEAEANKKIAASLTNELIEKIKYEKWNGEVPKVQGGNTPIVSVD